MARGRPSRTAPRLPLQARRLVPSLRPSARAGLEQEQRVHEARDTAGAAAGARRRRRPHLPGGGGSAHSGGSARVMSGAAAGQTGERRRPSRPTHAPWARESEPDPRRRTTRVCGCRPTPDPRRIKLTVNGDKPNQVTTQYYGVPFLFRSFRPGLSITDRKDKTHCVRASLLRSSRGRVSASPLLRWRCPLNVGYGWSGPHLDVSGRRVLHDKRSGGVYVRSPRTDF